MAWLRHGKSWISVPAQVAELAWLTAQAQYEGLCRCRGWTIGYDCGGRFCGSAEDFHVLEPEVESGLWEEVH